MTQLIIVAGLPGAGKSTYIRELKDANEVESVYDDYFATQFNEKVETKKDIDRNKNPLQNTRYSQLVQDLSEGKTVLVSDIVFYIPRHRNTFISAIIDAVVDVEFRFVFFEIDLEKSIKNIELRNSPDRVEIEKELAIEIARRAKAIEVITKETYDPQTT